MRAIRLWIFAFASLASVSAQTPTKPLKTATAVLNRYTQALGGAHAIENLQFMTAQGEAESSNRPGKSTFVFYVKPLKSLFKLTHPDGTQLVAGFDGKVGWVMTPQRTSIDPDTDLEANRRDADLQYPLHQAYYFKKLKLVGITDFEGHRCYWLHGTTKWGEDNNQFYDVETGLLDGWRFQGSEASKGVTIELFQDYKDFGDGRLIPTKYVSRAGDHSQTFTYTSVNYEPIDDSVFDLPPSVKALMK